MNSNKSDYNKANSNSKSLSGVEGTSGTPEFHNKKYTVTEVRDQQSACPSQFFLTFSDGRIGYARYRWGTLTIRISDTEADDKLQAVEGDIIFGEEIGGERDGVLSVNELKEATKSLIHYT